MCVLLHWFMLETKEQQTPMSKHKRSLSVSQVAKAQEYKSDTVLALYLWNR